MADNQANFVWVQVETELGDGAEDTSLVLKEDEGAKLPDVPFKLTRATGVRESSEILTGTARDGDTVTVTRGAEGTTREVHAADSWLYVVWTAGAAKEVQDHAQAVTGAEHGAVSADTANMIVRRDSDKRARVANPSNDLDIDNQGSRNTAIGTHAALTTGVHWASAGGIITFPLQSGAKASPNTARQTFPNNTECRLLLDTEAHDTQGEMDVTVKTGTTTSAATNKLIDSGASFAAADVGAWVWNTTDNTYTTVTAVDSSTQLSLAANIMPSGKAYKVYRSKFTAKEAGLYVVTSLVTWWQAADGNRLITYVRVNGSSVGGGSIYSSKATSYPAVATTDQIFLAVNAVLEFRCTQDSGGNLDTRNTAAFTNVAVSKIA